MLQQQDKSVNSSWGAEEWEETITPLTYAHNKLAAWEHQLLPSPERKKMWFCISLEYARQSTKDSDD